MSTNQPQNMKSTGSGGAPPAEFERPTKLGDLTPYLKLLLAGETLDAQRTAEAFEAIMSGHAHDGEIGALLALLATRTPTADVVGIMLRLDTAIHRNSIHARMNPAM